DSALSAKVARIEEQIGSPPPAPDTRERDEALQVVEQEITSGREARDRLAALESAIAVDQANRALESLDYGEADGTDLALAADALLEKSGGFGSQFSTFIEQWRAQDPAGAFAYTSQLETKLAQ